MRAPDDTWNQVKRVLMRVGVDADNTQVKQHSLRVELDRLAVQYAERSRQRIPTMREYRLIIDEAIGEISRCRDVFGERTTETYFAGDELAAEARNVLDRLEAKLRSATITDEARDGFEIVQVGDTWKMVPRVGRSGNARKEARDRYWSRLAKLWQSIVPAKTPHRYLINFVFAASGANKQAVRNYFDRRK